LKAPTQDSTSIKKDIRTRVIEGTKWNIGFVRNIACENRWRTDDADVHMPPDDNGRGRSVSYGQMKVRYAAMIRNYEKRIAELQKM
jgi:hypothetical protein